MWSRKTQQLWRKSQYPTRSANLRRTVSPARNPSEGHGASQDRSGGIFQPEPLFDSPASSVPAAEGGSAPLYEPDWLSAGAADRSSAASVPPAPSTVPPSPPSILPSPASADPTSRTVFPDASKAQPRRKATSASPSGAGGPATGRRSGGPKHQKPVAPKGHKTPSAHQPPVPGGHPSAIPPGVPAKGDPAAALIQMLAPLLRMIGAPVVPGASSAPVVPGAPQGVPQTVPVLARPDLVALQHFNPANSPSPYGGAFFQPASAPRPSETAPVATMPGAYPGQASTPPAQPGPAYTDPAPAGPVPVPPAPVPPAPVPPAPTQPVYTLPADIPGVTFGPDGMPWITDPALYVAWKAQQEGTGWQGSTPISTAPAPANPNQAGHTAPLTSADATFAAAQPSHPGGSGPLNPADADHAAERPAPVGQAAPLTAEDAALAVGPRSPLDPTPPLDAEDATLAAAQQPLLSDVPLPPRPPLDPRISRLPPLGYSGHSDYLPRMLGVFPLNPQGLSEEELASIEPSALEGRDEAIVRRQAQSAMVAIIPKEEGDRSQEEANLLLISTELELALDPRGGSGRLDDPNLVVLYEQFIDARYDLIRAQGAADRALFEQMPAQIDRGHTAERVIDDAIERLSPHHRDNIRPETRALAIQQLETGPPMEWEGVSHFLFNPYGVGANDSLDRYLFSTNHEVHARLHQLYRRDQDTNGQVAARTDLINALLDAANLDQSGEAFGHADQEAARGQIVFKIDLLMEMYEESNGTLDPAQATAFINNIILADHRLPSVTSSSRAEIPVLLMTSPDQLADFQHEQLEEFFPGLVGERDDPSRVFLYQMLRGMGYSLGPTGIVGPSGAPSSAGHSADGLGGASTGTYADHIRLIGDRMRAQAVTLPSEVMGDLLLSQIVLDSAGLQAIRAVLGTAVTLSAQTIDVPLGAITLITSVDSPFIGSRYIATVAATLRHGVDGVEQFGQSILPPYTTRVTQIAGGLTEIAMDVALTSVFPAGGTMLIVGRTAFAQAHEEIYYRGISADDPEYRQVLSESMLRSLLVSAGTIYANELDLSMGTSSEVAASRLNFRNLVTMALHGAVRGIGVAVTDEIANVLMTCRTSDLTSEEANEELMGLLNSVATGAVHNIFDKLRLLPPEAAERGLGTLIAGLTARVTAGHSINELTEWLGRMIEWASDLSTDEFLQELDSDDLAGDQLEEEVRRTVDSILDNAEEQMPR